MKIHFAEKQLEIKKNEIKIEDKLNFLQQKEHIEIYGNFIIFKNFTGIFEVNGEKYLIIPEKLIEHFGLIDETKEPVPNFEDKYYKQFEKFLKYILKELSKENLFYTLSLSHFSVEESYLNESKIFKLLLLLEKKEELISSLHLILSNPHRKLFVYETYKNLNEVSCIDPDVIVNIAQNPERLYETENGIIEYKNKKYSPMAVLQYETEETFDTIENRFIKYFLKELEFVLSTDLKEFMFLSEIRELKNDIEYALLSDIFSDVGELNYFPSNSQVLMKRSGYREVFQIYRLLHLSFVPKIFEDLDMAFSLKDMATLWEYYVLTTILKEFKDNFGGYEVEINFEEKIEQGTIYEYAKFKFNNGLILQYQPTKWSYSNLKFRPDIYIEYKEHRCIFDAKFRFFEDNKKDILQNMHYYKDGIKTQFAIAVCLGKKNKEGKFWKVNKDKKLINSFFEFIKENKEKLEGIGYLDLKLEMK
ncbi:DUF2357 domain-containing protein [Nitratiruptor tergarcus]|uniref:DUF2357 domain-containing protein n=1 Tax=Nitratiruptor tergarcus DSM 16512 TaxID=1069081 RepID=A0A1W1WSK7_9BACT|nr:DUF2357 domain-containing protein [Nitratiruptor tergarcus]SMC09182.1 hypothetical protein SAMN05660197_0987 [Nitratiruptor tergarcus DSM 16512]